jgi:hypothetical protein
MQFVGTNYRLLTQDLVGVLFFLHNAKQAHSGWQLIQQQLPV